MMKQMSLVALSALLVSTAAIDAKVKTGKTEKDIKKDNTLVIAKFSATWCGACKNAKPKFEALSDDKAYADVEFVAIDVDQARPLSDKYKIASLPTFVAFKGGQELERKVGYSESEIKAMIKKHKGAAKQPVKAAPKETPKQTVKAPTKTSKKS